MDIFLRIFLILLSISGLTLGFTCFSGWTALISEIIGWMSIAFAFKEWFFHIEKEEIKKFTIMAILFFGIIFIYTSCRLAKDALVMATVAGAEGMSTAKVLVWPFTIIYGMWYAGITRSVQQKNLVYWAIIPLVSYFIIFNFFLFGNVSILPQATTINYLIQTLPFLKYFFVLFSIWPVALYYVLAEQFAVTGVVVCLWQFINNYVFKNERKRFIPALMIVAQVASLLSGFIAENSEKVAKSNLGAYVHIFTIMMIIATIILFINNYYFFYTFGDSPIENLEKNKNELFTEAKIENKVDKPQLNTWSMIKEHPEYLFVGLLTIVYGICTVFLEQFWKDKVKLYFGADGYRSYMGTNMQMQSRFALILTMVGSNLLMRLAPWWFTASLTPMIVFFSCLGVFGSVALSAFRFGGFDPLFIACVVGSIGVIALKALKYAAFDPSKEAYIQVQGPESAREIKLFEGYIARIGKAAGALVPVFLINVLGIEYKFMSMCYILWILCSLSAFIWLYSVYVLNNSLTDKQRNNI